VSSSGSSINGVGADLKFGQRESGSARHRPASLGHSEDCPLSCWRRRPARGQRPFIQAKTIPTLRRAHYAAPDTVASLEVLNYSDDREFYLSSNSSARRGRRIFANHAEELVPSRLFRDDRGRSDWGRRCSSLSGRLGRGHAGRRSSPGIAAPCRYCRDDRAWLCCLSHLPRP
jgi:hypothetical protein